MNSRRVVDTFMRWQAQAEPIVLVTVYDTIGSTYSKAGHRILIAASGENQGLVSGGCLEGDLAERASKVLEHGEAAAVTYDLRDDADELFGLGIGCNGVIRVLLQPLTPDKDYEPFASIAASMLGDQPAAVATVIEPGRAACSAGATLLLKADASASWGVGTGLDTRLRAGCASAIEGGRAQLASDADGLVVLYAPIDPVPRLLVLGAGLDAVPLVNLASELGWRVTVADHRPAYVERGGFGAADEVRLVAPQSIHAELAPERFDAIVVMSHHLSTDATYLSQLAGIESRYLGILGPGARKERLLQGLGEAGQALSRRLKGPVGLDIGADGAESIALSVVAEIQSVLSTDRGADRLRTS